ncbi:hypothetical protein VTO42DRAFT_676 [Malbranchea cinnamomea]
MAFSSRTIAALVSALVLPFALVLFASGFFPYKPVLPGRATFDDNGNGLRPPAVFNKVIFMIVDSLRSDFVYSNRSGFEFTQQLIRDGVAVPFTAHASSPTVTMPRVKAITTGSVPSFVDVILNFAESESPSTLAHQDTWLAQLRARPGSRLVMYGDDTWLRLFPGMFDRHDGTTSFFVSDFTEVDNNVTRHVPEELRMDDWSAMIMHYLGLDHIGHKAGPYSPHMLPKQREMDNIVQEIYTAMESYGHLESTLLVLCGDHGMNDAGNHGGASPGETSPALTFISPKFKNLHKQRPCPQVPSSDFQYYETVEQSDIAATLAGLMGFPVPMNNLGVFIPEFLSLWEDDSARLRLLLENAMQILNVVRATFSVHTFSEDPNVDLCDRTIYSEVSQLGCLWQKTIRLVRMAEKDSAFSSEAESSLITFSRAAQDLMSGAASNYNMSRLNLGIIIASSAVISSGASFWLASCRPSKCMPFFVLVAIGYTILMFASSYVEEEQQFWYWMLTGWQFYLYTQSYERKTAVARVMPLLLAFLSRTISRWNQTGQKFAGEPDIAKTFLTKHTIILWTLILLTYTDIYQRLRQPGNGGRGLSKISRLLYLPLTSFAFIFKVSFSAADSPELLNGIPLLGILAESISSLSLIIQARLIFAGIGASFLILICHKIRRTPGHHKHDLISDFHNILSLFLITQSRSTNIPLYMLFRLQQLVLALLDLSDTEITITSLLMQYTTFFALGGSNSIASIDLSNAYNAVSSYNIVIVAILTYISNWAGPIWWVSATYALYYSKRRPSASAPTDHLQILTLFASMSVLSVMLACYLLRTHLFIWTVFSPKFLYSAAWTLGQHLIVNLIWGDQFLRWLYS